ncbi:hypothetical protein [Aquimarina hainanensis]|uniref:hypothetical protein n=1 Tax=Aquimarina hainanensis TaxID=1578017 RepID=UPI003620F4E9
MPYLRPMGNDQLIAGKECSCVAVSPFFPLGKQQTTPGFLVDKILLYRKRFGYYFLSDSRHYASCTGRYDRYPNSNPSYLISCFYPLSYRLHDCTIFLCYLLKFYSLSECYRY